MPKFYTLTETYENMIYQIPSKNEGNEIIEEAIHNTNDGVVRYRSKVLIDTYISENDITSHPDFEVVMGLKDNQRENELSKLILKIIKDKVERITGQNKDDNLFIEADYKMHDVDFYRTNISSLIRNYERNKEHELENEKLEELYAKLDELINNGINARISWNRKYIEVQNPNGKWVEHKE